MSSMNHNLIDMITRADFSSETNFKEVLRKKLFESSSNKKSGVLQFQRLSDEELDSLSGGNYAPTFSDCTSFVTCRTATDTRGKPCTSYVFA